MHKPLEGFIAAFVGIVLLVLAPGALYAMNQHLDRHLNQVKFWRLPQLIINIIAIVHPLGKLLIAAVYSCYVAGAFYAAYLAFTKW